MAAPRYAIRPFTVPLDLHKGLLSLRRFIGTVIETDTLGRQIFGNHGNFADRVEILQSHSKRFKEDFFLRQLAFKYMPTGRRIIYDLIKWGNLICWVVKMMGQRILFHLLSGGRKDSLYFKNGLYLVGRSNSWLKFEKVEVVFNVGN